MSIENCLLVCRGGVLCCQEQTICVKDCAQTITVRGGPFTVLLYPTGNTNEGTVPYGVTPADGTFTIAEPGVYTVDIDHAALDGTPCPDPTTAPYVCHAENCINGLLEMQILEALEALCAKIELGDDGAALAEIITNLEAICEKLLANGEAQAEVLVALQAICDKMLTAISAIEAVCDKLEVTNTSLEALCKKIEAMATDLTAALEAICNKTDKTNELLEALCKKIEDQTTLLATELAAILTCLGLMKKEQLEQGETLDEVLACLQVQKEAVVDAPDCGGEATGGDGGTPVGEEYFYANFSTDTDFAVLGNGTFQYTGSAPLEATSANFMAAINECLAGGNNLTMTITDVGGGPDATVTINAADNVGQTISETTNLTATDLVNAPVKVRDARFQCVTADSPPEPAEGKVLATYDACAVFCLKIIKDVLVAAQNCTKPLAVKIAGITKTRCCTGGLTAATPRCYTVYPSLSTGPAQEGCTYTLPDGSVVESYTVADFEAQLNTGWFKEPGPNGSTLYYADMGTTLCITQRHFSGGIVLNDEGVLVGTGSLVASVKCGFSTPNTTTPECKDMLDVKEKNSEPIASILAESLATQQLMLQCQQEQKELLEAIYCGTGPAAIETETEETP